MKTEVGKFNKARLRQARTEMLLTQQELARMVGVSQSAITDYELGRSKPSLDVLERIAEVLHKPISYFFDEDVYRAENEMRSILPILLQELRASYESTTLPLLGTVPASNWQDAVITPDTYIMVSPHIARSADYALTVRGNSMYPHLKDGDIVYVRKCHTFKHRDVVVARNRDGEVTLKRVIKHNDKVWLKPDNPDYETLDAKDAEILGVVIGSYRREP